jgi:hypothetical protein
MASTHSIPARFRGRVPAVPVPAESHIERRISAVTQQLRAHTAELLSTVDKIQEDDNGTEA